MEPSGYDYNRPYQSSDSAKAEIATDLVMLISTVISLPLNGAAIYATYSKVQKDVVRIYVINLLVSDLVRLCSLTVATVTFGWLISYYIYWFGLIVSVGFMACIALERCSVVFCPQASCFRQSVKVCAAVCFFVWFVPLCFFIGVYFSFTVLGPDRSLLITMSVFSLLPCPFLIFSLGASLLSLCAFSSEPINLKLRVVGSVVLLVLIYMLLLFPSFITLLRQSSGSFTSHLVLKVTVHLHPLADVFLYFFLTKRDTDNNVSNNVNRSVNDELTYINSSV